MKSGVYLIAYPTGVYVGSSLDVEERHYFHVWHLRRGDHANKHLQNAWRKYGEDAFVFEVIQRVRGEHLRAVEQAYLDYYLRRPECVNQARSAVARLHAEELMPKYGPIDVVTIDGQEVDMWEDAKEFNRRVDAAVAEAKKRFAAARKKSTWVGGVCPDYYRIPIPALDVEVMPFDIIDALKLNFNLGCCTKYVLRAGRKGLALDDLRKAKNCLEREIARLEAEPVNPPR